MRKPIGIVVAMVKVPHALRYRAFTTANPRPANATTTINSTATAVAVPVTAPSSSRAISGSERPFRRMEATRMMKSCTAPASTAPITSQRNPGRKPNCAASTGPSRGPAPAIAAK